MKDLVTFVELYRKPGGKPPSERTLANYRRYLEYFAAWWEHDLRELTPDDFDRWVCTREWGSQTAYTALAAIKAYARTLCPEAPILQHSVTRIDPSPGRAYGPEICRSLLAAPDGRTRKGRRDRAILSVMLECGWRCAEVAALRLDRLVLHPPELTGHVKGGRWRTASVKASAKTLRRWLEVRANGNPYLFINLRGDPLTRSGVYTIVKACGELIGIQLSPHDLRRSGAVNMLRSGAPDSVVMAQFGWKDYRVFQRYILTLGARDASHYTEWINGR